MAGTDLSDAFSIDFQRGDPISVLAVIGELDMTTAPQLDGVLRCVCASVAGQLHVDAAELSFCDCAGLAVLLTAARRCRVRGGELVVTNANATLQRLAALVEVDRILGITSRSDEVTPVSPRV